jgi:pimeloyl-ACP methyl ester carboxylesterase
MVTELFPDDFPAASRIDQRVMAVIASCGGRSATFVGNSLDGMAALWTALDGPHLVERCVLIGAPGVAFGGRADPMLGLLAVPPIARVVLAGRTSPARYARVLAGSLEEPALLQLPDLGRAASGRHVARCSAAPSPACSPTCWRSAHRGRAAS